MTVAICGMTMEGLSLPLLPPVAPETSTLQPGPPCFCLALFMLCFSVQVDEVIEGRCMEHARGHEGGDQKVSSTSGLMAWCIWMEARELSKVLTKEADCPDSNLSPATV